MRLKPLTLTGWGRHPRVAMEAWRPERQSELAACLAEVAAGGLIAHGGGRSYGDQALNAGGRAILTTRLDRLLDFDETTGLLTVEPGVTFQMILRALLKRGWRVPVSPGTGFATIGGAVANDVHGKNHDREGSFGDHVRWFDLLLPSGESRRISAESDQRLFQATIGGMGLTGIIHRIGFTMIRAPSDAMRVREERIRDLDHFIERLGEARRSAHYSVGWIDALARGGSLGRGILETASHDPVALNAAAPRRRAIPIDFPGFALNSLSVRAFNALYFRRVPAAGRERRMPMEAFLYPLDAILSWNRIYGRRGFHQFQCVLPDAEAARGLRLMLETVSAAGAASFLAVLKTLGGEGLGMLSFPRRGFTLALDFPRKPGIDDLLAKLERQTLDHGGRIYPAKDSALSSAGFAAMYPRADEFRAVLAEIDPRGLMTSDMARRLGLKP